MFIYILGASLKDVITGIVDLRNNIKLMGLDHQFCGGLSTLQQIKLLFEKPGSDVPATVLESQEVIAHTLAAQSENLVLSVDLTDSFGGFKLETEGLLREVDTLKVEHFMDKVTSPLRGW